MLNSGWALKGGWKGRYVRLRWFSKRQDGREFRTGDTFLVASRRGGLNLIGCGEIQGARLHGVPPSDVTLLPEDYTPGPIESEGECKN